MSNPLLKFIDKVCVQTAVYWEASTPDGFGGFTYKDPVEIQCRWDGTSKLIKDDKGTEVVAHAEILVNQDLEIDSLLFLGSLDDLDSSLTHEGVDAYPIITKSSNPLFKSTDEFVRVVYV